MPRYELECKKCSEVYDLWSSISDKTSNYKKIACPNCVSKSKQEVYGVPSVKFENPVGTDRWHSDSKGHDYRHKYNMDRKGGVRDQRKNAEKKSHVGPTPYRRIDDISSGKHFGEVK